MNRRLDRPATPWHLYLLAIVAIAIIVFAITQIGPPTSSARTSRQVVTAQDGVVQSTVSGSGNVEAGVDDTVNFGTSGVLQAVYVHVGEHVTKGELLAELDPAAAELTLDQANEELTAAKDNLTSAEDGTSTSGGSGGSGSGGSAETSYDRTTASSSTRFVDFTPTTTTPSATTPAPSTTPATSTTPGTGTTPGAGTVPTRTVTVTVTTPSSPTSTGSRSHAGTSTTDSSPASTRSGSGTSSTTAKTTTTSTPSPAAIASAQASVDSAEATVKNDEAALAATKLYAPVSGEVATLSSVTPGQTVSSSGSSSTGSSASSSSSSGAGAAASTAAGSLGGSSSSSASSSGFAEIINSGTLTMTVAFSESNIASVKVGQAATISISALSGVEIGAHVTAISPVGSTSSDVVSYNATLTGDQNNPQIRPGMSATATVITGQAQGVTIPNAAITGAGTTGTVNVMKNGKTVTQSVVVGLRGTERSQIISGVSSGEDVVEEITLPALGTSTTSSSSSSGTLGGGLTGAGGFGGAGGGGFAARLLGGGGGGGFFRGGG